MYENKFLGKKAGKFIREFANEHKPWRVIKIMNTWFVRVTILQSQKDKSELRVVKSKIPKINAVALATPEMKAMFYFLKRR